MKSESSLHVVNYIIALIDESVWKRIAVGHVQKQVPQNILKINQHAIQSFVLMTSKSYGKRSEMGRNEENKKTLQQSNANNRIRSLRIKTELTNETPSGLEREKEKVGNKLKRVDELRSTKGNIRKTINELRKIQQIEVDLHEQMLRGKQQKLQLMKKQQIEKEEKKKLQQIQNFKAAKDKLKHASYQVAYDYDGHFFNKNKNIKLKNEKLFSLKYILIKYRTKYGEAQVHKNEKEKPKQTSVKNEMMEVRKRENETVQFQKNKMNKFVRGSSVSEFINRFDDQTLSEGVKISEMTTNTLRQKSTKRAKLLSLRDFKTKLRQNSFKQYKFSNVSANPKKKLKTLDPEMMNKQVETMEVLPTKIQEIREKWSEGKRRVKTFFRDEESFSLQTKISKLRSEKQKEEKGRIKIGNTSLYEEIISQD